MPDQRLHAVVPDVGAEPSDQQSAPGRPAGYWWAWQPLHGGSGVTTLQRATRSGYVFPADTSGHEQWPALPVVVVVRDHSRGVQAAEEFAGFVEERADWVVLGLVVMPSTRDTLPRLLSDRLKVVAGAYRRARTTPTGEQYQPAVWTLPWVERWFCGEEPTTANTPNPYRTLVRDLAAAPPVALAL